MYYHCYSIELFLVRRSVEWTGARKKLLSILVCLSKTPSADSGYAPTTEFGNLINAAVAASPVSYSNFSNSFFVFYCLSACVTTLAGPLDHRKILSPLARIFRDQIFFWEKIEVWTAAA